MVSGITRVALAATESAPVQPGRPQSSFNFDWGSGSAARGSLLLERRLTTRSTSSKITIRIVDFDQDREVAELLNARIAAATTMRAAPALQIFIEERRAALRSCAARCSYLFIGARGVSTLHCTTWSAVDEARSGSMKFRPISPDRNAIVIVLPLRCDLGLRIDPTQCEK
jgi:hypothetical protein